MKRTMALVLGVLALLGGFWAYNVWRGETDTIVRPPSVVEQGRAALHNQLVQAELREAQIEKLYWNAPEKIEVLIQSHQQRIEKLAGNPAGGEIIAHDNVAIARLQKRIADIEVQRQAEAAAREAAAEAQAEAAKAAAQETAGTTPSNP